MRFFKLVQSNLILIIIGWVITFPGLVLAEPAVIPCENGYNVKISITKSIPGPFRSHDTNYGFATLEQNGNLLSKVKLEENQSYVYTREGYFLENIEFDYGKNNFAMFIIDHGYIGFNGHASDGAFTLWDDKQANKCLIEQID